jgi:hypothetical protein
MTRQWFWQFHILLYFSFLTDISLFLVHDSRPERRVNGHESRMYNTVWPLALLFLCGFVRQDRLWFLLKYATSMRACSEQQRRYGLASYWIDINIIKSLAASKRGGTDWSLCRQCNESCDNATGPVVEAVGREDIPYFVAKILHNKICYFVSFASCKIIWFIKKIHVKVS